MSRKPDLKAPRYTPQAKNLLDRSAFIRHFKSKFPQYSHLTEPEVRKIVKTFNETIVEQVIENRDGVNLPEFCGRLFIGSCKKQKPNMDYKKTANAGTLIQHRNYESDDYLAKIFYSTYDIKHAYKNHELYAFKGCRNFTRSVGRTYPSKWKIYIQVEPFKKITNLFKHTVDQNERKDRTEEYLLTYDEFEF
jgi:hypothetical protein